MTADRIVGWGGFVLACGLAFLALGGDPCGDGLRYLAVLPAGFLIGLTTYIAVTRSGRRARVAVPLAAAVGLGSGAGLFFLTLVRWAEQCTR